MTPSFYRAVWFCAGIGLISPAVAVEGQTGTLTVYYASSGPGEPDGYENASVNVEYAIRDCPGDILLAVRRVRGSVKASQRYWFEGEQVPSSAPPPTAPSVEFTGTILDGGKELARFSYLGLRAAGDARGLGCASGDTQPIGSFSDFLGKSATAEEKERFLKRLTVRVDNPSRQYLANAAIGDQIRAARAKAKKEAEAAESEARKKAEAKARADSAADPVASGEKRAAAGKNTGYANGDFWGTDSTSKTPSEESSKTGTGRYARTPDNRFFERLSDGTLREISGAEYQAGRDRIAEHRNRQAAQETERRNDAVVREVLSEQRRQQRQTERTNQEIDRITGHIAQSYYAAQAAGNASRNISDLSNLDGNYSSAAALEQDYQRRMSQLQQEVANLEAAQRQEVNASKEFYFGGGSAGDRAFGEVTGILANMMRESEREEKARRARQRLDAQRSAMLKQIAEKRQAALVQMRKNLISTFPEGSTPLSSHTVGTDVLYFFSYALDEKAIEQANPSITLSNTFPIAKYGDGTWPFKQSVLRDLSQHTAKKNVLVGYYTSKQLAESMRASFIRLAKQSGFSIADVVHKGSTATPAASRGTHDFWSEPENGGNQAQQETDFWRSDETKKPAQKSQVDFWK